MAMRKENEFTEAVSISNSIITGCSARMRAIYLSITIDQRKKGVKSPCQDPIARLWPLEIASTSNQESCQ